MFGEFLVENGATYLLTVGAPWVRTVALAHSLFGIQHLVLEFLCTCTQFRRVSDDILLPLKNTKTPVNNFRTCPYKMAVSSLKKSKSQKGTLSGHSPARTNSGLHLPK